MKKMIAIIIALGLAGFGTWFFFFKKDTAGPNYITQKVDRGDIRASVSATGTVNPVTTVLIGTQISGSISALYADFNSTVRQGQLLAQIDPTTFEAQVDQARANLMVAKANLEKATVAMRDAQTHLDRNRILFGRNFISKSDLDASENQFLSAIAQIRASEAQVQQAEASLKIAQTNLRYTRIVSPVNGTVISRAVDVGQTVAASFQTPTLFTIAQDLTKMQINTSVDEADIGLIRNNQSVTFTVDAYPGLSFDGSISEVRNAPTTVQNVVTYDVIVNVENPELKLKPGMTANVSVIIDDKQNVLRVPNAALRFRITDPDITAQAPKGPGVWILEGGSPQRVLLRLGISDNRFTEVLSGDLSENTPIIVGSRVNNRTSGGPAQPPAAQSFIR